MFDYIQLAGVSFRQGLVTLQSVITRSLCVFFCALNPVFFIGRGGAVQCNSGLSVKAARRSLAVTNTPITLVSNHFSKTKGGHYYA